MENRGPRSLAYLAQKGCIKYLKRINDIGDCPYELIRPVLLRLENPEQLHQLEINSPQIIGHDGEIWLQLIKRDIPNWESKPHQPKDPKNWWKLYKKLKEQTQKDREQGAEKLKAAFDSINDEKTQNLAKVLSRKELPQEPTKSKARTLWSHNPGRTAGKPGHKLSLLEKIRKEARDARLAKIQVPASRLLTKSNHVTRAPAGLVEGYKREAQQKSTSPTAIRPPTAYRVPKPPLALSRQENTADGGTLQAGENRLKALTGGRLDKSQPESEPRAAAAESRSKHTSVRQAAPPDIPPPAQIDGADDYEDTDEPDISDPSAGPKSKARAVASSPPKKQQQQQRMGTPPLPRFGSPGVPHKRKAEPSIFMSSKKPKAAR